MFGSRRSDKKVKPDGKDGLNIIIVGCGKVGNTLVESLVKEGHEITIVDKEKQRLQAITNLYDVMAVEGNGASFSTLESAGIKEADLIIAVTNSDELNLLCCTVAKRVGDCSAIARVRTPDYFNEVSYLREQMGLAMIINPEFETAREIADVLCMPDALEVSSFAHGRVEVVKYKIEESNVLNGLVISEISGRLGLKILICALERDGEVLIPNGDVRLMKDDVISLVVIRKDAKQICERLNLKSGRVKDCVIIGGGRTAYYLANQLIHMGVSLKIIESDAKRCEQLSILLPKATIINGDGTDEETLKEERIESTEAFIPLTGIDEENILLTLYAKQVSNAKVVTKINRLNFKGVVSKLDLGSTIYPRYIVAETIIAYVRAKKNSGDNPIETLYHLFDNRVEAIEFIIDKESRVTNVPLKDLPLKPDVLITSIYRSHDIIIPSGTDSIRMGDSVMVVTKHSGFTNILDILA
ncbi:MAG: Trk system potassium transporter TrkA [Lachnospiraceae bacterium]|nr:Trk system potassium transporter TrkA [Lachnospiraceae bacterium]